MNAIQKYKRWKAYRHLKKFLNSNKEGWLLTQRGNRYTLDPVTRDADSDAFTVEFDGETEYVEDNVGMMHYLGGVPFGLRNENARPIVDATSAAVAQTETGKINDEHQLSVDDSLTLSQIIDRLTVGTVYTENGSVMIVNPFHALEDEPDIVDLRSVMRLFRHDADPKTPIKAAKNAIKAERAVSGFDWSNAAQIGGMLGAFLLGAIATEFIAGSAGGGMPEVNLGLMILLGL
jgi:hypothetical protein